MTRLESTALLKDQATIVRRGVTRLAHRLRAERPPGALSGNKVSVLSHLYRHGPSTPSDIATAEQQHPQSLTRVFAELTAAGLVTRRPSPSDGRQSVLSLTDLGRQTLSSDMADRDTWLADALDTLTPAEVGLLVVAAQLMDGLVDAQVPATARRPDTTRRSA